MRKSALPQINICSKRSRLEIKNLPWGIRPLTIPIPTAIKAKDIQSVHQAKVWRDSVIWSILHPLSFNPYPPMGKNLSIRSCISQKDKLPLIEELNLEGGN